MRVIAGKYRSRPLRSLRGMDLRPTADRLRETLFDVLCAGNRDALEGSIWIDLFAGTGAVGIEAISRGARAVYFVESSKRALELIEQNLAALNIGDPARLVRGDAIHGLRQLGAEGVRADFIFLDPPYEMHAIYAQILDLLAPSTMLSPNARVMAEHEKRFDLSECFGVLRRYRKLVQGDAALSFYSRVKAG